MKIRTRYAPSPTGRMHVGNLRTALYAYLIAKHEDGDFILRIEDTDQGRYVEGAVDIIKRTMADTGLIEDEGPDKDGGVGPYVQSERMQAGIYGKYAQELIDKGEAYRCFCTPERLATLTQVVEGKEISVYDKHCLHLSQEEIEKNLAEGKPYVIRQNNPTEGTTTFHDELYGDVTVDNKELDDMILIKSDGYPTYNFANVVDDHLMKITHVVRGNEYISSSPKYNRLYEAFGWEVPKYIHWGWSPDSDKEIFSLKELVEIFDYHRINKAPSVFDYQKLRWMNGEYLKAMDPDRFYELAEPYLKKAISKDLDLRKIAEMVRTRIEIFPDITEMVDFFESLPDYDISLYTHKKMKTNAKSSLAVLKELLPVLEAQEEFTNDGLFAAMKSYIQEKGFKNGYVLWPVRIAVSGKQTTPAGATEIMEVLGKEETIARIREGIRKLEA